MEEELVESTYDEICFPCGSLGSYSHQEKSIDTCNQRFSDCLKVGMKSESIIEDFRSPCGDFERSQHRPQITFPIEDANSGKTKMPNIHATIPVDPSSSPMFPDSRRDQYLKLAEEANLPNVTQKKNDKPQENESTAFPSRMPVSIHESDTRFRPLHNMNPSLKVHNNINLSNVTQTQNLTGILRRPKDNAGGTGNDHIYEENMNRSPPRTRLDLQQDRDNRLVSEIGHMQNPNNGVERYSTNQMNHHTLDTNNHNFHYQLHGQHQQPQINEYNDPHQRDNSLGHHQQRFNPNNSNGRRYHSHTSNHDSTNNNWLPSNGNHISIVNEDLYSTQNHNRHHQSYHQNPMHAEKNKLGSEIIQQHVFQNQTQNLNLHSNSGNRENYPNPQHPQTQQQYPFTSERKEQHFQNHSSAYFNQPNNSNQKLSSNPQGDFYESKYHYSPQRGPQQLFPKNEFETNSGLNQRKLFNNHEYYERNERNQYSSPHRVNTIHNGGENLPHNFVAMTNDPSSDPPYDTEVDRRRKSVPRSPHHSRGGRNHKYEKYERDEDEFRDDSEDISDDESDFSQRKKRPVRKRNISSSKKIRKKKVSNSNTKQKSTPKHLYNYDDLSSPSLSPSPTHGKYSARKSLSKVRDQVEKSRGRDCPYDREKYKHHHRIQQRSPQKSQRRNCSPDHSSATSIQLLELPLERVKVSCQNSVDNSQVDDELSYLNRSINSINLNNVEDDDTSTTIFWDEQSRLLDCDIKKVVETKKMLFEETTKAMELRDSCEDVDEIAFWDNQVKTLNKYLTKSNIKERELRASLAEYQRETKLKTMNRSIHLNQFERKDCSKIASSKKGKIYVRAPGDMPANFKFSVKIDGILKTASVVSYRKFFYQI